MTIQDLSALIRSRRSLNPNFYEAGAEIERADLEQLLENANWAPTHKRTEPWRFRVFHSAESRERLGAFMAEYYRSTTPAEAFSEERFQKASDNAKRSGAVIALCMQQHPEANLPDFEELAAVACAVQNMWLSCTALGLGAYWSTPGAALKGAADLLDLQPDESCLGLFFIGKLKPAERPSGTRTPVENKTRWM